MSSRLGHSREAKKKIKYTEEIEPESDGTSSELSEGNRESPHLFLHSRVLALTGSEPDIIRLGRKEGKGEESGE